MNSLFISVSITVQTEQAEAMKWSIREFASQKRIGTSAGALHRPFAEFSSGEGSHGLISSCHPSNYNSKAWEVFCMNAKCLILLGGMHKDTLKQSNCVKDNIFHGTSLLSGKYF